MLLVSQRSNETPFQIYWTVKTLSVTGIGLVIVLFTKQRTTAVSPSDKNKTNLKLGYVPRVWYVLNLFVAVMATVEVEKANIWVQP